MKKIILKLELQDAREKRKALKTVTVLTGIDEISMDMKGKKLTIIGTVDPVSVVSKLRKFWWTEILIVGPAKEPEKKIEETKKEEEPKEEEIKKEEPPKEEEPKKEEPPKVETKKEEQVLKEEPKKEESPKEEPKKEEEEEKKEEIAQMKEEMKRAQPQPQPQPQPRIMPLPQPHQVGNMVMPYRQYYPPMHTYYQVQHMSIEENPNACVIC